MNRAGPPQGQRLTRETFTYSRQLEYLSENELVAQTGCPRSLWFLYIAKELLDNALDETEGYTAPVIHIRLDKRTLSVSDNGRGIDADVITRIFDLDTRTSNKQAYISPTRGAQGNALKTILAIPFIRSGHKPSTLHIIANGVHHRITVSADVIAQKAQVDFRQDPFVKRAGTTVQVSLDSACSEENEDNSKNLQTLVLRYALFNPHAVFVQNGKQIEATLLSGQKGLATVPNPPRS